ncbi:hypothetical protein L1277_002272 [Okibacterium sp. HSC-33S16]|uniref:ECF transporter S component n=1 Tax=Okibacterium sp. HSC-33S16 TaxID=2910965 RepID=UPI00209E5B60|nr:ECF transporter S component [Okibacterium sp. HSC-33S16]MCP2032173.1 hypothetical protein [Okibacterium sp. HSC-33S16]
MSTSPAASPRWTSVALLQCAAIGAIAAIVVVVLVPLTGTLALASPLLYALVAGVHAVGPMLALRWTRTPGAAILAAAIAGLLAAPFNGLGLLLAIALVAPAAALEAVLALGRYRLDRPPLWYLGAATAGTVIFALSLLVIDEAILTPFMVWGTLVCRLLSYSVAAWVTVRLESALARAGTRRVLPRHH